MSHPDAHAEKRLSKDTTLPLLPAVTLNNVSVFLLLLCGAEPSTWRAMLGKRSTAKLHLQPRWAAFL